MNILVTGGAGFIGSAVVRALVADGGHQVITVDKLTYASSPDALSAVEQSPRHAFEQVDICDDRAVHGVFARHAPDAVMHLAAETHVDRSIDDPSVFVENNVRGTGVLLEAAREYWSGSAGAAQAGFRFHHVSTDEVFGSLGDDGLFTETSPYDPSSPYAASKAAADHLVRAWHRTYGMPVVLSNSSNNYGPYQFPEKLIPLMIIKALAGDAMPVYGDGMNVRDWIYVEDHAAGLIAVLEGGQVGESYNIGGDGQKTNLEVVQTICDLVDEFAPRDGGGSRRDLIAFVEDRPGHDRRYAIDGSKIARELNWKPAHGFDGGLRETVRWYLDNQDWWRAILDGRYGGERLGLAGAADA